jgi:hypothetical protein
MVKARKLHLANSSNLFFLQNNHFYKLQPEDKGETTPTGEQQELFLRKQVQLKVIIYKGKFKRY